MPSDADDRGSAGGVERVVTKVPAHSARAISAIPSVPRMRTRRLDESLREPDRIARSVRTPQDSWRTSRELEGKNGSADYLERLSYNFELWKCRS